MNAARAQLRTRTVFNSLAPQPSLGENSPQHILSRIEPVNLERTERRSVTCGSVIFHEGNRISETGRFAKLLRVTASQERKFYGSEKEGVNQLFWIRKLDPLFGAGAKLRPRGHRHTGETPVPRFRFSATLLCPGPRRMLRELCNGSKRWRRIPKTADDFDFMNQARANRRPTLPLFFKLL